MNEDCAICESDSQYVWRVEQLESGVKELRKIYNRTMYSSIGTLIGVIILLVMPLIEG